MKPFLQVMLRWLNFFGFNPLRSLNVLTGFFPFLAEYRAFRRQIHSSRDPLAFPLKNLQPCLGGRFGEAGTTRGHYFHQDLLVAREIYRRNPQRHVDVGSRMDGFVAHVASFREVEVFDIRPSAATVPGITFRQADLMNLPEDLLSYTDSLSCLHALEHFGLGRYGDPLDPDGHRKGLTTLHSILKPGGTLYLSVPIGPQRIEFNAHRVFSIEYLIQIFEPLFTITSFSYVDDAGDLHPSVSLTKEFCSHNGHCQFGCGIFELKAIKHVDPR